MNWHYIATDNGEFRWQLISIYCYKKFGDSFHKCTFVYPAAGNIMKDSINYFSNLLREQSYLFYQQENLFFQERKIDMSKMKF